MDDFLSYLSMLFHLKNLYSLNEKKLDREWYWVGEDLEGGGSCYFTVQYRLSLSECEENNRRPQSA
jgi:hypothetical protein